MDSSFRIKLKKDGIAKKGLFVNSPVELLPSPSLNGLRRTFSSDSKSAMKGILSSKDNAKKSPTSPPTRRQNKHQSNSNNRRHGSFRGTHNESSPYSFKSPPPSPPVKRFTPPTSPLLRRPSSPVRNNNFPEKRKPLKCLPVLQPRIISHENVPPKIAKTSNEKPNSRPPSPRRSASPRGTSPRGRGASPGSKAISEEELKTRVQKVLKARLYLLHQPGPNSFSVGSESPNQKYKVIIGPQSCSCGHSPYCVHVLFVMIRVLKMNENDPLLSAGCLKDYEVEQLLSRWEERRKKAIRARERRNMNYSPFGNKYTNLSPDSSPDSPPSTMLGYSDNYSVDGQCPICLMDMNRSESLVVCDTGCRNFLHHHCMSVWAADRHSQGQPLLCPLCRAPWASKISTRIKEVTKAAQIQAEARRYTLIATLAGNDSAYSSPCASESMKFESTPLYMYPPTVRGEISIPLIHDTDVVPLPYSDPIPHEHEDSVSSWIQVYGQELIACLFSRDWAVRETGLRRLAHEVTKALKWDFLMSSEQNQRKIIECCATILAQVSNDPVYKVYIACLRCVKVLFSHLCPVDGGEVKRLQILFRPLINTLLLKCADGNRRTSQISLDFLIELSRGQRGELALATHLSGRGLGGITYVLSCILDDSTPSEAPWQWLLGRLCVLDRLLDEFPIEFQLQIVELGGGESGYKLENYDRLMTVVEFSFKALGSRHTTVSKLARRIYICCARMAAVEPAVFNQVCDMLAKLDVSLQTRLKQRLRSMQSSEKRSSGRLKLPSKENKKLLRSMSYSPNRMLSAMFPQYRGDAPSRPTQLPLHKFKERKMSSNIPIDLQETLLSLSKVNKLSSPQKVSSLMKSGLSAYADTLDSLEGARKNLLLKEAIGSPVTPPAPYSTPINEVPANDVSLPNIPDLELIPKYLDECGDSYILPNEESLYEEGKKWMKGSVLGTGAFSTCFQARDSETGTLMAVKQIIICRNSEEEQEKVVAAIEEEILMMSRLRHPNIVRLIGSTRVASGFCLFTEWMAGGSVANMLEKYGPFSDHVIINYTKQILHGVSYLHDNKVLHRDLKGANLLVDSTGQRLRIGDFGTAVRLASKSTITGEFQGQLLGTIAFMAPEVLRGDDYGRACDVWSVGCCILEMATTKPPWGTDQVSNQYKLMFRIATSPSPPHVPEFLSADTRDLALQCLQINSEHRPSTEVLLKHKVFKNQAKAFHLYKWMQK